jgi:hypothetical protein
MIFLKKRKSIALKLLSGYLNTKNEQFNRESGEHGFKGIITDIENELGNDLPGMYRDDRGIIYHPHKQDTISLGTRMVEVYEPPDWTFNRVLYIEKEGFFPLLKEVGWPDRHDCALLTSKGQPTRAARDLIDGLRDSKEEITVFCIHDADAAGTIIYQSLQNATKARPARKVKVENLGLEPWEGVDMGLEPEKIEPLKDKEGNPKLRPVADYVPSDWAEWLQTHRIELNAMTSPQFLQWLDDKMEEFGQSKLIPPAGVLSTELHKKAHEKLAQEITNKILKEQDAEGQIERAYEKLRPTLYEKAKSLTNDVTEDLGKEPDQSWRDPILKTAHDLVERTYDNHQEMSRNA